MDCCDEIINVLADNSLAWWTLVLSIVTTLLWGVYVYFTIRTFKEVQEQTKLQSRAFLVVKPVDCENVDITEFPPEAIELHTKWRGILERNLPDAVKQETSFVLKLINRGKSDVIEWKIRITGQISVGEYLESRSITGGDPFEYVINSKVGDQIAPGEELSVHVIPAGFYPKVELLWVITYKDFRKNCDTISSQVTYELFNRLAFDYK